LITPAGQNKGSAFTCLTRYDTLVITVRTYFNLVQAELDKSLLDDYEIFCDLWDENGSFIPAVFAVPVRLVVAEDEARAATLALRNDLDLLAQCLEPIAGEQLIDAEVAQLIHEPAENRNPWELLVLAGYFFAAGICFLGIRSPKFAQYSSFADYLVAKVRVAHLYAWIFVAVGVVFVGMYFYFRRMSNQAASKGRDK